MKEKETYVPRGHIWLEGDNKRASYDSRHFGCVSSNDFYSNKKTKRKASAFRLGSTRINHRTSSLCYLATTAFWFEINISR